MGLFFTPDCSQPKVGKRTGSMRFTDLGSIVIVILNNYSMVWYHLLLISFLLIKEGLKRIIIIIYFVNKKWKNNIISSTRPLIGCWLNLGIKLITNDIRFKQPYREF